MTIYYKDDPRFLDICFRGIFRNTLLPDEIIVVKDGPLEKKLNQVVDKYINKFPKLFKTYQLKFNQGSAIAANFGLSKANNDWVIKQDADDFSFRERYFELMRHTKDNVLFFGSLMYERYEKHQIVKKVPITNIDIKKNLNFRNPFNNPSMCLNTKLIKHFGGYPNIKFKEDWGLWIKAFKNSNCFNLDKVLLTTINNERMIEKRRGLFNIKSEYQIQKLLVKYNYNNFFSATLIYLFRVCLLLLPTYLLKLTYKFFLR